MADERRQRQAEYAEMERINRQGEDANGLDLTAEEEELMNELGSADGFNVSDYSLKEF